MTITDTTLNASDFVDAFATLLEERALEVVVPEGDPVCVEGEASDTWWYVIAGTADVTRNGRLIGMVGPGETIGETAVLDGRPRTATVIARTDLRVRVGEGTELRAQCADHPEVAFALARQFATRLRDREDRASGPAPVAPVAAGDAPAPEAATVIEYDPEAPGYFDDPSVQLDALREATPLVPLPDTHGWMLTRYADVQAVSRDRRLGNDLTPAISSPEIEAERAMLEQNPATMLSMLRRDGDDHLRLRRLVSSAFTPKAIKLWRERTVSISNDLLDDLAHHGGGDLIADYALPLPVRIISEMLGFPTDDADEMRTWSHQIALTLDGDLTDEERRVGADAMRAMLHRIAERYEVERAEPGDGILAALVHAEVDGHRLTRDEVMMNVALLYVAGHETTTNLIGNGVVQLLRHPDQLHRLRVDPSLDANVVEEVMRFDSPVQVTRRIAKEPVEVAGETIDTGTVVLLSAVAANRDPRHWGPTAGVFQIDRPGANAHVSFGGGPHHCLGAALARLEGSIALPGLVRRFPHLRAVEDVTYEPRVVLRGLGSLSIEV